MFRLIATLLFLALPAMAQPNIVLILVDDMSANLMPGPDKPAGYMPNLAQMQADGMTFRNFITSNSLCCPSRASTFTGLLPHNTGVLTNTAPEGGNEAFIANGNVARSFAARLQTMGYKTGFFGKYLNGWIPTDAIPTGWNKWVSTNRGYQGYDYTLNNNGVLSTPPEHMTDTIANLGKTWMTPTRQPFFSELAPFSPHAPYIPAIRHEGLYLAAILPKTPAWDTLADPADPAWLQIIPEMKAALKADMQAHYVDRLQSMASIDDMIGAVRAKLVATGMAANTYIIFTSDNGYHMGEMSLRPGKMTPFDFDARAPFIVVGPGITPGSVSDALVQNIDLAPTFAELAGAAPMATDGRSMVPLFTGGPWTRTVAVIEHYQEVQDPADPDYSEPKAGDPPTYTALRGATWLYVAYGTGETGYYDMITDPHQMNNVAASLALATASALALRAAAMATCAGNCGALQDQPNSN